MKPYYEEPGIVIYHGDCREVLPTLADESVAIVFTSPPYNQGGMSGGYANLSGGYASYSDQMPAPSYAAWQAWVLAECWRVLQSDGAIFYNHKPMIRDGELWLPLSLNPGLPIRQIITWDRGGGFNWGDGFFVPRYEWLILFAKPRFAVGKTNSAHGDVWSEPPVSQRERSGHPAPFPVGLPKRAIGSALNVGIVLDPFAGSGSTLVAAKATSRPDRRQTSSPRRSGLRRRRVTVPAFLTHSPRIPAVLPTHEPEHG